MTAADVPENATEGPVERPEIKLCSRCGVEPRADQEGTNPWCRVCRATYQRDYDALRQVMKEKRGYALGILAMRDVLAAEFDKLGFSSFTGIEVATLIRQAPGPKVPD